MTIEHDEDFGDFLSEWKAFWADVTKGLERMATKYRVCVERGRDMSPAALEKHAGIPRNISLLIKKVAEGMPPEMAAKMMGSADTTIEILSTVSPEVKKAIMTHGLPVSELDDAGQIQTRVVPLGKVNSRDAARAIDRTNGQLRSAEEQVEHSRKKGGGGGGGPLLRGVYIRLLSGPFEQLEQEAKRKHVVPADIAAEMVIEGLAKLRAKRDRAETRARAKAGEEKGATDQPGGTQ